MQGLSVERDCWLGNKSACGLGDCFNKESFSVQFEQIPRMCVL